MVLNALGFSRVMLTLFYLWRRNLALNVIIHASMNAPLLLVPLLAPYLQATQPGMQATRSARPISGGVPNTFPFPSVGGVPAAHA